MTDTTDIKALRAETWDLHTMQDATEFANRLLDLLEAERQRAERAKSALDSMTRQRDEVERLRVVLCDDKENLIDKCIERDKEIAALKGDQVPFAYAYHRDTGVWWLSLEKPKLPGYTEVRELFTAPQKPVVLPSPYYGDRHCLDKREVIAAIEASGGTVKDPE